MWIEKIDLLERFVKDRPDIVLCAAGDRKKSSRLLACATEWIRGSF